MELELDVVNMVGGSLYLIGHDRHGRKCGHQCKVHFLDLACWWWTGVRLLSFRVGGRLPWAEAENQGWAGGVDFVGQWISGGVADRRAGCGDGHRSAELP